MRAPLFASAPPRPHGRIGFFDVPAESVGVEKRMGEAVAAQRLLHFQGCCGFAPKCDGARDILVHGLCDQFWHPDGSQQAGRDPSWKGRAAAGQKRQARP